MLGLDNRVIERLLGEIGIEKIGGRKADATLGRFRRGNVCLLGSVSMEQLGLAPVVEKN